MDMVKFVSLVVAMTFAVSVVAKDGKLQELKDGAIDISKKYLAKVSRAALICVHGEYRAKR